MPDLKPTSEPSLGYRFGGRSRPSALGYSQLQARLTLEPRNTHFNPQYLRVSVFSPSSGVGHLSVCHPRKASERYRLYPDRIILRDHNGQTIEAFVFGGKLQVSPNADRTLCTISSEAPILELVGEQSISAMLAVEVEELLAGERCPDERQLAEFEGKIAQADPLDLYAACLLALKMKLKRLTVLDVTQVQLLRAVTAEMEALRQLPAFEGGLPTLKDILPG
jgi:hypothetical protein